MVHIPVLQKEVLKYLSPGPNENFIDCTAGGGGHTLSILEKNGPNGKVLGIDQDPEAIKNVKLRIADPKMKNRLVLAQDNYANLKEIVQKNKFKPVNGILLDLGLSSWDLEQSKRGFTFLKKEPLDMRYNPESPLTAEKILNYWSKFDIERILKEYGEESFSKQIAEEIIIARKMKPITNTLQLVQIIERVMPSKLRRQKIHFATKTFQALRIAVNNELENLKSVLPQALEVLAENGRLVVISFHSLEDRIVKEFIREEGKQVFMGGQGLAPQIGDGAVMQEPKKQSKIGIITKSPVGPTPQEFKENPRSRSAKLRAIIKK